MINQSNSIRVFGGPYTDQASRASGSTASQDDPETANNVGRRVKGPRRSGNYSVMLGVINNVAGATVTVQYSNLPNPDVTNDAHWFADPAGAISLDAATAGVKAHVASGKHVEWIRIKTSAHAIGIYCYYSAEGVDY